MLKGIKKTETIDVINALINLQVVYDSFRSDNGLTPPKMNGFEVCASLMDKGGRMAREIKHYERKDPKKDWPDGLMEAITGYMVYILLIMEMYGIDFSNQHDGVVKELESSIKQYTKEGECCGGSCGCAGNCGGNCACKVNGKSVQCACKSKKAKKSKKG